MNSSNRQSSVHSKWVYGIPLLYLALSVLWIALSDRLIYQTGFAEDTLTHIQTIKGLFFVTATTLLLFVLLRRYANAQQDTLIELNTREKQYRLLAENATDIIALLDMESTILYVTPSVESLIGYTPSEMIGENVYRFIHPDDIERIKRKHTSLKENHQPGRLEYRIQTQNGEAVWFESSFRVIQDEEKQTTQLLTISRNIMDRKTAEGLLQKREKEYRRVVENIQDMVWCVDLNGKITYVSQSVKAVLGYDPNEIVGKSIEAFFDQEVGNFFLKNIEDRKKGVLKDTLSFELHHPKKEGGTIICEVRSSPVYNEQGHLTEIVGISRDITRRKEMENALIESQKRYQLALDGAELATWDWDIQTGEVIYNSRWAEMLGYQLEEVEPTVDNWKEKIHPNDRPKVFEALYDHLEGGNPNYEIEHRLQHKNGEWIWVLDRGRVIEWDEEGKPSRAAGIHVDITERKLLQEEKLRLEAQLRQSHKMEAVGQLAGGVAHDFNNLLTTILGCSDMILSEMGRDHEYKDMLEAIKKAGERATSLTRQLLAFSRKQILEPKILDLNHLIFDIHKMLHRMIGENIEYIAIPEKNLVRVKADPGQIEQIVLNLAVNARDAMPDGGKLILETKNVELDTDFCRNQPDVSPGRYAKLVVSDTGHGMDAETAERIFEPFFTTKDKGKGTGLGLSMVYGIMKQSGGHITVESEPGQGTTFQLFFPQVKEEESELEEVDESPEIKLRGHETILLVEDDAMVRDFTETILAKHGYTVLSASYADEAFRIHQDHKDPIDLLLTDVVLPKVSGKEIAQTITAFRPGLKVLYMSGYTDEAIVHQGILEEGIRFLPKPFSGPTLLRAVRRYLDE